MLRRLSIQGKTSKKVNEKICETIYDGRSDIREYSKVEAASLYNNSSGGKYEQSSKIQRTNKGAKSGRTKASES